jgi:hypothetical protein
VGHQRVIRRMIWRWAREGAINIPPPSSGSSSACQDK